MTLTHTNWRSWRSKVLARVTITWVIITHQILSRGDFVNCALTSISNLSYLIEDSFRCCLLPLLRIWALQLQWLTRKSRCHRSPTYRRMLNSEYFCAPNIAQDIPFRTTVSIFNVLTGSKDNSKSRFKRRLRRKISPNEPHNYHIIGCLFLA